MLTSPEVHKEGSFVMSCASSTQALDLRSFSFFSTLLTTNGTVTVPLLQVKVENRVDFMKERRKLSLQASGFHFVC